MRNRFLRRMSGPHNRLAWSVNWASAVSALPSISGLTLDLGCGASPYRELLAQRATIVAADWPLGTHGKSGVDILADDSAALPFRDGCADAVTAFQVLEHLQEPATFLREAYRVLRSGGHVVLTTPFMWGIHEAPHDYYRYTAYGLQYLLTKAGFEVLRLEPVTGFWSMLALKLNYRAWRYSRRWTRPLWRPFWALTQWIAPKIDLRRPGPDETAGYLAIGRRP